MYVLYLHIVCIDVHERSTFRQVAWRLLLTAQSPYPRLLIYTFTTFTPTLTPNHGQNTYLQPPPLPPTHHPPAVQ